MDRRGGMVPVANCRLFGARNFPAQVRNGELLPVAWTVSRRI